jgi:hypothetical protein
MWVALDGQPIHGSPIFTRDTGYQEIYALNLKCSLMTIQAEPGPDGTLLIFF